MSGIYKLTLNQLYKVAKDANIYGYSTKRNKRDIIHHILENANVKTIKQLAKKVHMKKYYRFRRDDLIKKINPEIDEFIRDAGMEIVKSRKRKIIQEKKEKKHFKKNDMIYLDKIMDVEKYANKGFRPYNRRKTMLTKINKSDKLKDKHINNLIKSEE